MYILRLKYSTVLFVSFCWKFVDSIAREHMIFGGIVNTQKTINLHIPVLKRKQK